MGQMSELFEPQASSENMTPVTQSSRHLGYNDADPFGLIDESRLPYEESWKFHFESINLTVIRQRGNFLKATEWTKTPKFLGR